ncbi:hypothetical protein QCA50_013644 [Cerrena zonata]|uniref:Uncharacterized protein n=1 Tax=Cerrena zonata TaxID=2478898 RepID=A0AAW0G1F5_9APHY
MRSSTRLALRRSRHVDTSSQVPITPSSSSQTPCSTTRSRTNASSRSRPQLDDPSCAPALDRPFIMYGLDNVPYLVKAQRLQAAGEQDTFSSAPVDATISSTECHEQSNSAAAVSSSAESNSSSCSSSAYRRGFEDGVKAVSAVSSHVSPGVHLARNQKKRAARKRKHAHFDATLRDS